MRNVYNGYTEKFLTGAELKNMFRTAFYCLSSGRQQTVVDITIPEYLDFKNINNDKFYRIFYKTNSCKIMNEETDKHIDYFKYLDLSNTIFSERYLNRKYNICPKCNTSMIIKKGSLGYFFGCKDYPNCKGKKKLLILGHITYNGFSACHIPE